jgi:hypothetical protein
MAVERRTLWLAAALGVALIWVIVVGAGDDTPVPTATRRPAPAVAAPQRANDTSPAAVELVKLDVPRAEPIDGGRDPFRFGVRPTSQAPAAERLPGVADDQAGAPPPRMPTGPPPPPPITLKFIGLVVKADGTKLAVLSDGKGPPISGTEGQEIEGRYKILKIGTESIEIAYIDGRGRQTIRLTGQ